MIPSRTLRLCALLVALLMAGCLTPPATPPVKPARAPASLALDRPAAGAATPVQRNLNLTHDGTVPQSASFCPDLGSNLPCANYPSTEYYSTTFFPPGNYTWADLTFSWTATSTTSQTLVAGILNRTTDSDGTEHWHFLGISAKGPSPLHLQCAIPPHDPKSGLVLLIEKANLASPPAYASATLDQPYHLQGNLTLTEAPS